MKIIDIMKHSAELLGLTQEREILNTATEENEAEILQNEEICRMLNLSALSIQELCSNYISIYIEEEVETEDKKYPLNKLKNYIRMLNIKQDNDLVKFKIVNRNIIFEQDGKYTIKFASYPDITSMFDTVEVLNNLSPDVLVMGLCSYYAISRGMFKEFETFHDKYIEKANALKDLKMFELPFRRWEWKINKHCK